MATQSERSQARDRGGSCLAFLGLAVIDLGISPSELQASKELQSRKQVVCIICDLGTQLKPINASSWHPSTHKLPDEDIRRGKKMCLGFSKMSMVPQLAVDMRPRCQRHVVQKERKVGRHATCLFRRFGRALPHPLLIWQAEPQ
jgi:hypothetical protein